jgi:hypothetical protein
MLADHLAVLFLLPLCVPFLLCYPRSTHQHQDNYLVDEGISKREASITKRAGPA